MRLSDHSRTFSLAGIPMVGNLATGGVIGLTDSGRKLCEELTRREVAPNEIPNDCVELARHLERGGYLAGEAPDSPRVLSAYLHVTQRCNLACRFCYSEDAGRNALDDPSLEDLCRAIDLLVSLGVARLVISGGEPFLRDDLALVADHAKDAGIEKVVVLTNGLLVTEARTGELVGTVSCVAVAFDGASAQAPAHLRGQQRFERLVEAVRIVRASGMEARILPTLHAGNVDDIEAYGRLAQELGATLGFSLLTGNVCELGELSPSDAQLREMAARTLGLGLPGADPVEDAAPALSARPSCGAGVRTLSVAADGTVYPCHMLHDVRLAMGSAFLDTAEKIMGGPVAQRMRELDAGAFETCSTCDARYLCAGGCRARALMSTGRLDACDPYCELSRFQYEYVGKRLAQQFGTGGGE